MSAKLEELWQQANQQKAQQLHDVRSTFLHKIHRAIAELDHCTTNEILLPESHKLRHRIEQAMALEEHYSETVQVWQEQAQSTAIELQRRAGMLKQLAATTTNRLESEEAGLEQRQRQRSEQLERAIEEVMERAAKRARQEVATR